MGGAGQLPCAFLLFRDATNEFGRRLVLSRIYSYSGRVRAACEDIGYGSGLIRTLVSTVLRALGKRRNSPVYMPWYLPQFGSLAELELPAHVVSLRDEPIGHLVLTTGRIVAADPLCIISEAY